MENEIKMSFLSKRCNIAVIRNMLGALIIENNPTITFIKSESLNGLIFDKYNSLLITIITSRYNYITVLLKSQFCIL